MSEYSVVREEMASPGLQKRPSDDDDSGFDEVIDDAATFELLPTVLVGLRPRTPSSPAGPQAQLQSHVADAAETRSRASEGSAADDSGFSFTTPEYSPLSPSPRPLIENGSTSSTTSTQPDSAMTPGLEAGGERSRVTFPSPSPAGSEEDVSEKGKGCSGNTCKLYTQGSYLEVSTNTY